MPIYGLMGTGDFTSAQRPQDWRETTLRLMPNGTAPITALTAMMKKKDTTDPIFNWMYKGFAVRALQVNGAINSANTALVVDSGAKYARIKALLLVPRTGEIMRVSANADNDTGLTVERGFAGSTAAAILDNDQITIIGSAYSEGSGSQRGVGRVPIDASNYTQIFKTPFEITNTAKATETRDGEDALSELESENLGWHMEDIERSIIWGVKSSATDADGELVRTTQGLNSFISTNRSDYSGAGTVANLYDYYEQLFRYGQETRLGFAGNRFVLRLNKLIAAEGDFQWGNTMEVYGMKLKEFITPFGTVMYKRHPLLTLDTYYNNSCWHVSPENMIIRPLKGRDTKLEENIQNKDEDKTKHQFITELGFEWHFEETFGVITNL